MSVCHVNDRVPGAIYVGRAMPRKGIQGSPFRNPFRIFKDGDRQVVLRRYRDHLERLIADDPVFAGMVRDLHEKPLACWCRHIHQKKTADNTCHADILLEVAARLITQP